MSWPSVGDSARSFSRPRGQAKKVSSWWISAGPRSARAAARAIMASTLSMRALISMLRGMRGEGLSWNWIHVTSAGETSGAKSRPADFAVITSQRLRDELVRARSLVGGQSRTQELGQLVGHERLGGLDDGVHDVSVVVGGQADHARPRALR